MTPLEIQKLSQPITDLYLKMEYDIMMNIIKHLRNYKELIPSDEWQIQKLAEMGALNKETIKIIAKYSRANESLITEMLEKASMQSLSELEIGLSKLVERGILGEAVEPKASKNIIQVFKTYKEQSKDILNMVNTTMLMKANLIYVGLVNKTVDSAKEIANKQSFLDIMNRRTGEALIGSESRQQAMVKIIREFNQNGIPAFVDKRGREWAPEGYVNMCLRTTSERVANETQMARCDDYGIDLVQVDSHSGARPKCAKDQGKIFDRSNKSTKYPHWNTSSYGEPDGLLGINCGHHIYPFVEGVNIRRYFPTEDLEANNKEYKLFQGQRKLERDIRKTKREIAMLKELGADEDTIKQLKASLKDKQNNIAKYVKDNNLVRRKNREQVVT